MMYSDPIAQVKITDADTKEVIDWVAPKYPFLTGVNIDIERGERNSGLSFSIEAPYTTQLVEWFLGETTTPFKHGNLVRARIGYASGKWTPWYGGYINADGVGINVGIDGISGSISVAATPRKVMDYKVSNAIWSEASGDVLSMFESFSRVTGIEFDVSDEASALFGKLDLALGGGAILGLQGASMFDAMNAICNNYGCKYWFASDVESSGEPDKIYVKAMEESQPAIRTYILGSPINEELEQYPLFSYEPESGGAAFRMGVANPVANGTKGSAVDTDSGEIVSEEVKATDQEGKVGGSNVGVDPEESTNKETDGVVWDDSTRAGEKVDYASGPMYGSGGELFKRMVYRYQEQGNPSQVASITTIGIPAETTSNGCHVLGCGGLYNGKYEIQKLSHAYTPGAWEMTLNIRKKGGNAVTGIQQEPKGGQDEN